MTRRRWVVVLVMAAAVSLLGVVGTLRLSGRTPQPLDVVVVLKATSAQMEFWEVVEQGIAVAARETQVKVRTVGPSFEHEIDEQVAIVNRAIDARPDGIVLAASDYYRLADAVARAAEAGIPVVTVDSDVNGAREASFVGTGNFEAGRRAAREMLARVGPDVRVAIVSHVPGVATAIERERGVRAVLAAESNIAPAGPFYAYNDEQRAEAIVEHLQRPGAGIGGIVTLNETSTVGVGRALEERGLVDRMVLVGFDASKEEIELLERDTLQALVVQKPFNMGYLALHAIADTIRGRSVPDNIDTGIEVVTAENMFSEPIQRLIFPIVR